MKRIVVFRHAAALDPLEAEKSGVDDRDRPLTAVGRRDMEQTAAGLKGIIGEVEAVFTSPLVRAVQTAEIIAGAIGAIHLEPTSTLSPGIAPEQLVEWLDARYTSPGIAIVGHEPDLSRWLGWVLCGRSISLIKLKKGTACEIRFEHELCAGGATLRWTISPAQLRMLNA